MRKLSLEADGMTTARHISELGTRGLHSRPVKTNSGGMQGVVWLKPRQED